MFKKASKKKRPQSFRRQTSSEDDEGPSDNEGSLTQNIQKQKRRRKLLEDVQYKRGINALDMLHNRRVTNDELQEANFDTETDAPGASVGLSQEAVLQKKHQRAMEEFIKQNMHPDQNDRKDERSTKQDKITADSTNLSSAKPATTTDQLYAELAEASRRLTGKQNTSVDTANDAASTVLAGTGITDVILPVKDRLQTMEETANATLQMKAARLTQSDLSRLKTLPSSTHRNTSNEGPGALPHRFAVPSRPEAGVAPPIEADDEPSKSVDDDRPGFAAVMQSSQGKQQQQSKLPQTRDDRVFKKFVSKERAKNR